MTRGRPASSSRPPSSPGLASAGVDVLDVGVLPTPAVAFLTADLGADLGAVISASHNPMPDNGLKFLARGGHKLADDLEDAIEAPAARGLGAADRSRRRPDPAGRHAPATATSSTCCRPCRTGSTGCRVVVDAAHGAAYLVAPEVLRRAGAEVVAIGDRPDGLNINDGYGSTHLDRLRAAVREHGADAGIALDGDADRCLAVDAARRGRRRRPDPRRPGAGDARGRTTCRTTPPSSTVMSNLGFRLAMAREGVSVVETAVGDRYVLEAMKAGGFGLGGEQSGHVIMLEHATTGDGTLTALHLLARVAATGKPLAELAAVMDRLPQVLVNVSGVDRGRCRRLRCRCRRRSPPRRPSSAPPAGCCCAPAAPSRSCA